MLVQQWLGDPGGLGDYFHAGGVVSLFRKD